MMTQDNTGGDLLASYGKSVKNQTLAEIMDAATIPRFAGGGLRDLVEHVRAQESDHDPLAEAMKLPEVAALVDALRNSNNQIEYLHERLGTNTGSGNAVYARNCIALAPFTAAKETP